ncbi:MAG: DNA-processing protein DprA [Clostridiales Family XIII bacterium]|jgi:DNA processing protein|nr:DNA-processing protein DprA [Clostridiales Family XIII bacterium]
MNINTIDIDDPNYPMQLREIPDPPQKLYYTGDISKLNTVDCVSVVGSRHATKYGQDIALRIGESYASHGIAIVSGMAQGIDSLAHRGALKANGLTVAVLGTGIDVLFPKSAYDLRKEIYDTGIIISEYPPGTPGAKWTFPLRNRIISGLSKATIIVEAGIKSGSLITAEHANNQNRYVFAVPGNIDRESSLGCNKLIGEKAMPLVYIDDAMHLLGMNTMDDVESSIVDQLGSTEKDIYRELCMNGELTYDQLRDLTNMEMKQLIAVVSVMEMKGIVTTFYGRVMKNWL